MLYFPNFKKNCYFEIVTKKLWEFTYIFHVDSLNDNILLNLLYYSFSYINERKNYMYKFSEFLSSCVCKNTYMCRYNVYMDFPGISASKESAYNAGDPGLIPGSGRSPGEDIGYLR